MAGFDIELEAVSKRYGDALAVDGVSLGITRGEFLTLLGPSGCGKTTTLNMIAGFIQPSSGSIRIRDRSVTGLPPFERDTAMVFQSYALFPHMTVSDNVAFGLRMRRTSRTEVQRRVTEALESVHLTGLERRYPRQLSGGQQQRVALARAIVTRPAALLLDEPLSNLDLKLREAMRLELKNLQRNLGITSVYVTHDQGEALAMSDRIAVMNDGRIEQLGTPETVYEYPESLFVATFVGDTNLLAGEVAESGPDGVVIRLDSGDLVPARPRDGLAAGARVSLAFRPEKCAFGSAPVDSGIAGRITTVLVTGPEIRYEVTTGAGEKLTVLALNAPGAPRPETGEEVSVQVAAAHCTAFPAGTGAAG